MEILTTKQIKERLADCGKTVADLCRAANVSRSTFDRWDWGSNHPKLGTYLRVLEALLKIERESGNAPVN